MRLCAARIRFAQGEVIAGHIREHLQEMKKLSQYAIALDGHVAPPPSASHERELLSFHVEDVIFLTECVARLER